MYISWSPLTWYLAERICTYHIKYYFECRGGLSQPIFVSIKNVNFRAFRFYFLKNLFFPPKGAEEGGGRGLGHMSSKKSIYFFRTPLMNPPPLTSEA